MVSAILPVTPPLHKAGEAIAEANKTFGSVIEIDFVSLQPVASVTITE
jgi:hypothetical protein